MNQLNKGIVASNTNDSARVIESEPRNLLVDSERGSPNTRNLSEYSLPSSFEENELDSYSENCRKDEYDFIKGVLDGEKFDLPQKITAECLQDFYDGEGNYQPRRHLPFAQDVLLGMPENVASAQSGLIKLGLHDNFDFGGRPLVLERFLEEPHSFWYGDRSTRLGRLGGKKSTSKTPTVVSEEGLFFREFETHGRPVPFIDQNIFMKRRMDQDLTAVLNEHYKDTPEDQIPALMSFNTASVIIDLHLPFFQNQVDRRISLDQEATREGFVPASRLETNVIESEMVRRKNKAFSMLAKRAPVLDEEKKRQMDRKRQNKIDSRARQKAQKAAAQHVCGF
jgi:hypothetical protein